jgi:hypothetical protein
LTGDVDGDGDVDVFDVVIVANAYGSHPGSPKWDPRADLDGDSDVDIFDVTIVASHYGDNERVEADLEFIVEASLVSETSTNDLGSAAAVWNPAETGRFTVGVILPSSFSATLACWSDSTQVNAYTSLFESFDVVKRPVDLSVDYSPEEPTLDDDVTLIASCFDTVLGEPVEGLNVNFHAYDLYRDIYVSIGNSFTNSSGVGTLLWHPKSFSQQHDIWPNYFLRVMCVEGEYTEGAEVEPIHIDTRYPTRLEFLGSEVMDVHVGFRYDFQWRLASENGTALAGKTVWVYPPTGTTAIFITTDSNGVVTWWDWASPHVGTFYWKAFFHDLYTLDWYYRTSNEVRVVAVADVLPVSILFDVQPREFKRGDDVTLVATVFDVNSGLPLSGVDVSFYVVDAEGEAGWLGDSLTNGSGVATYLVPYVIGPNAYFAKVGVNQTIMSSTVTLTAAEETSLKLDVERDESGFSHTISGCLLSHDEPVDGRLVKIYVNDTLEAEVTTQLYGSFSVAVNLPPANNKPTTYAVQAVFQGDDPCNATAYGFTPNGTRYAICTTIQYGNKPVGNSTWLTVEPQATQVMQSTKTPEEMQVEAEQSGWLSVWHEWSWWYPWYRLHFDFAINNARIDLGFNPVLPGGETLEYTGLESAFPELTAESGLTPEEMGQIVEEAMAEAVIGTLVATTFVVATANLRILPSTVAAMIIYSGGLSSLLVYASFLHSSGTHLKAKAFVAGLVFSLFGIALSTIMSVRAGFLFENVIFTTLSSLASQLVDPSLLKVALMAVSYTLVTSIAIGLTALLIPEPSSIYFKPAFLVVTLIFAATGMALSLTW